MSRRDAPVSVPYAALLKWLAGVAVLGGLLYAAQLWMVGGRDQLTRTVVVDGRFQQVRVADVEALLRTQLNVPLAEVDLEQVRRDVEQLPWVASALAVRRWPDVLLVHVREREAVARWGETALLDADSRIFIPAAEDLPPDLPRLSGPEGSERVALQEFHLLSERLRASPLQVSELSLDARGEWRATTPEGIELWLGSEPPQARAALLRAAVVPTLAAKWEQVDLRYANGFAVAWREQGAGGDSKQSARGSNNG
jgi:cell division protein FtsQ